MKTQKPSNASALLSQAKRLIIKVGSALLVDTESGRIRRHWLKSLVTDIQYLRQNGQQVVIVSSGAIALGRKQLNQPLLKRPLAEAQAAAAVGQIALAHVWTECLNQASLKTAQILLTLDDSEDRTRYLNARATLETLLRWGVVPVINENDTVATSEIRYGDNDRLAARVGQMISADVVVLLSDIDGLYTKDPHKHGDAEFIGQISHIDERILLMGGASHSRVGTGGMSTKIAAAQIATAAGCHLCICSGHRNHPLKAVLQGARASWFKARVKPVAARKQWIAGSIQPKGKVYIDQGAFQALQKGKSLLSAGVIKVVGQFSAGDTVSVFLNEREVARGLISLPHHEAKQVMGQSTRALLAHLGEFTKTELIHRNDLVLLSRL